MRRCPVSGLRGAEMGARRNHTRTHKGETAPTPSDYVGNEVALSQENASAARSLYMIPSPSLPSPLFYHKYLASTLIARVLSIIESPLPVLLFLHVCMLISFALLLSYILVPAQMLSSQRFRVGPVERLWTGGRSEKGTSAVYQGEIHLRSSPLAAASEPTRIWREILFWRRRSSTVSRYEIRHSASTPTSIEASKDFARIIAYGIKGKYDDPNACLSSVVQTYKNFTADWQWASHDKIDDRMTLSTSNVSLHEPKWLRTRWDQSL